jgi:hypothetical protein
MITVPPGGWLSLSAERDQQLALRLAAWREGFAAGTRHGHAIGYTEAEKDMAAAWRTIAEPIAHPERGAGQRIRLAEHGGLKDAAAHEHAFTARAYATPEWQRTDVERACVQVYPPPKGARILHLIPRRRP